MRSNQATRRQTAFLLLRISIPLLLIVGGVLLLEGCIPLPFPESPADPSQKDIRKGFGAAGSKERFRIGQTRREEIVFALGVPRYASRDGRSIAYTFDVHDGVLVFPLCFAAYPLRDNEYAVRLDFDSQDFLANWKLVERPGWGPDAIDALNADGPKLEDQKPPESGTNR